MQRVARGATSGYDYNCMMKLGVCIELSVHVEISYDRGGTYHDLSTGDFLAITANATITRITANHGEAFIVMTNTEIGDIGTCTEKYAVPAGELTREITASHGLAARG